MQTHTAAVGAQPGSGCWRGGRQRPLPPNDAHQHRPLRGTPWAQPGRSQTGAASRGGGGVRGLRREQLSAGGTRGSVPAAGDGWAKGLGAPRGWAASAPWGGENRRHPTRGGSWRAGAARLLPALRPDGRIPHPASRVAPIPQRQAGNSLPTLRTAWDGRGGEGGGRLRPSSPHRAGGWRCCARRVWNRGAACPRLSPVVYLHC